MGKIGLTRRVKPAEGVAELSGAAAPCRFDIRKLHFFEEASTLEDELHKHFAPRAVNRANLRKNSSSLPRLRPEQSFQKNMESFWSSESDLKQPTKIGRAHV